MIEWLAVNSTDKAFTWNGKTYTLHLLADNLTVTDGDITIVNNPVNTAVHNELAELKRTYETILNVADNNIIGVKKTLEERTKELEQTKKRLEKYECAPSFVDNTHKTSDISGSNHYQAVKS
jgi:hypothetical protein